MIRLKNEKQINGIRKSCKLLAQLYEYIIPQIKAGMSTKEIDERFTTQQTCGADYPSGKNS